MTTLKAKLGMGSNIQAQAQVCLTLYADHSVKVGSYIVKQRNLAHLVGNLYRACSGSIRRLLFGRRASAFSFNSAVDEQGVLPDYSLVDPNNSLQDRPAHNTPSQGVDSSLNNVNPPSYYTAQRPSPPPRHSLRPVILSEALPGNTVAQSEPYEFHYWYPIESDDAAWAALHLHTRNAIPGNPKPSDAQPRVPQVWSCDPVAGMIELDYKSLQTIQQIKISLKGKLLTSSMKAEAFKFMNYEFIIWQRSYGDPRHLSTRECSSNGKFDENAGDNNLISFFPALAVSPTPTSLLPPRNSSRPPNYDTIKPKELSWITGSTSSVPSTPRSNEKGPLPSVQRINSGSVAACIPLNFLERGIPVTVVYELAAIITRGRFRPDSKFKTNLSYIPALHPMPASQKRREAYESNSSVPGRIKDPDGWFALPKVASFGMFPDSLGRRSVAIDCTLYLSEPLSYACGGVIPWFLRLSSTDGEALRSLSTSNVPVVKIFRRLRYFEPKPDDTGFDISGQSSLSTVTPSVAAMSKSSDFMVVGHELGVARWRVPPDEDVPQESHVRYLEGELHLRLDLQPSCACRIFYIEASLQVLISKVNSLTVFSRNDGTRGRIPISPQIGLEKSNEPPPMAFSECPPLTMRRIPFEDAVADSEEGPLTPFRYKYPPE